MKIFLNLSQKLNMKILFNNVRRVVKNWEYLRFHDSKAKCNFSSHSNYASYHPITDIMWS